MQFRVQQEEKEDPKRIQNIIGGTESSSPKMQLRGFLTSPRSLKHLCSSKSSVSPETSVESAHPLNSSELLQQRRSSKSPSRLDIRRFSKELFFNLPRSPKSPKMKSSSSLETRRLSSDLEEHKRKSELKTSKTSDIRLSAKDIRIQTSRAIGRRLSKDASSWFTNSPPDLNTRRKSHLDVMHSKSLSVSENVLDESPKSAFNLNATAYLFNADPTKYNECGKDASKSLPLPTIISKAATLRLASSGSLDAPKSAKIRPRLPSPPKSPVIEFRTARPPKINISDADNLNVYDTIISKEEKSIKKNGKSSHNRSKSLDNKHLNFQTTTIDIFSPDGRLETVDKQTVNYATLEHKKNNLDQDRVNKSSSANGNLSNVKNALGSKDRQFGIQESKSSSGKKPTTSAETSNSGVKDFSSLKKTVKGIESKSDTTAISSSSKEPYLIYAEPQKSKRERKEDNSTSVKSSDPITVSKPKVPPKNSASRIKQARACSAPETSESLLPSVLHVSEESFPKMSFPEHNYYSEHKRFQKSDSFPERYREIQCYEKCFDTHLATKGCTATSTGRRLWHESDRRAQMMSHRSRSVPEQRFTPTHNESEKQRFKRKNETPILVLEHFSKLPDPSYRNPGILKTRKSRSREEADLPPAPPSPAERRKRQESTKREIFPLKNQSQGHLEPP